MFPCREEANWLHAATVGVTNAIPLVANIAANLIAFLAFIGLINHVLDWSCMMVGFDECTCSLEVSFLKLQNFWNNTMMPD